MTATAIDYRAILEARATELRRRMRENSKNLHVSPVAEPLEQSTQLQEREVIAASVSIADGMLGQVLNALVRMDAGEFGECLSCSGKISAKRLAAVPWEPFCLTCAEIAERQKAARRTGVEVAF